MYVSLYQSSDGDPCKGLGLSLRVLQRIAKAHDHSETRCIPGFITSGKHTPTSNALRRRN